MSFSTTQIAAFLLAMLTVFATPVSSAADVDLPAILEANGFPADQFECLFAWHEFGVPRASEPITGCRIAPRDGGVPFDAYFDGGRALTAEELKALGIVEKDWSPRQVSASAEPWAGAESRQYAPVPKGVQFKRGFSGSVELPPLDVASVKREDAESLRDGEKGVRRIGVLRDVPGPIAVTGEHATHGGWESLGDGSLLWSVALESPGAMGIRVQIRNLSLPRGATLLVYNAANPGEVYGPFDSASELWTPTCFGDTVIIECALESGASLADVSFVIERIAHIYADFASLPWSKAAAGACNLDVTCYPDWADTALGVGGLGSIGLAGALWCTGSLIVDLDPCTQVPFLLTANHCIPTEQQADTLEVYWLYQTPTCNGTPPSALTVPRTTGGSERIAFLGGRGDTGGGNDFCLLRLRNSPPNGLSALGWATSKPPLGTDVTCIHHPRGDYKRISFGGLTDTDNPYSDWFHEVIWSAGTTEPGSSGSPLFISATQQIIGQLWGGGASCSQPTAPDYYGRFDVTYVIIESHLQTQATIGFEETGTTVNEDAGEILLTVSLNAPAVANVSIECVSVNGSAVAGEDFAALNETIEIAQGQSSASIPVSIIDGLRPEDTESFTLELHNAQCSILDEDADTVTIHITDNDIDTDGDGLSDGEETTGAFGYISDLNRVDTDTDGISDPDEVFGTNGFQTNPSARDTDGDGMDDLTEVILGLNPLDPLDIELVASISVPWFQP